MTAWLPAPASFEPAPERIIPAAAKGKDPRQMEAVNVQIAPLCSTTVTTTRWGCSLASRRSSTARRG